MKIQIFTDYAIRVLLYLHKSARVCTAVEIAGAVGMSYQNVLHLARALKRKGLVDVTQGRYGGYILRKPITQMSVYEVYSATSGELDISPCPERRSCINGAKEDCATYDFFMSVQDSMIARMEKVKLSDLTEKVGDEKRNRHIRVERNELMQKILLCGM